MIIPPFSVAPVEVEVAFRANKWEHYVANYKKSNQLWVEPIVRFNRYNRAIPLHFMGHLLPTLPSGSYKIYCTNYGPKPLCIRHNQKIGRIIPFVQDRSSAYDELALRKRSSPSTCERLSFLFFIAR